MSSLPRMPVPEGPDVTHVPEDPDDESQGRTLASAWREVAGVPITGELLAWPPDVFALTDVILERSQAYRLALSTGGRVAWPPSDPAAWSESVVAAGEGWSGWVEGGEERLPALLTEEWDVVAERAHTALEHLGDGRDWRLWEAVLTLHAIADEACAGLGGALDMGAAGGCRYRARGRELLARTGSIARLPPHRIRVLPKARTPPSGTSLASLSRYACVQHSEVEVRWHKLPTRRRGTGPRADHANFLLLPWPLRVRESDFRPLEDAVQTLASEPSGLFEFLPSERLDLDLVERLLVAARDEVDNVDVVIMPESAVDEGEIDELEALLDRYGVGGLHTGVRQCAEHPVRPPGNWVHTGVSPRMERGEPPPGAAGERWFHIRQHKHNRWLLDEQQVYQYHLGGALHPHVRWWEAIDVPRRSVQFIQFGEVTVAILVCEDLAQNDRVSEVLRSVGPTMVLAPLLDGPQITSRWAARYASVLADDPGSAVLTVTSFGMTQRSRPHGRAPSPVVALWKDPVQGAHEIPLEAGAQGVLVTACADRTIRRTRDGRVPVETGTHFFDVGVHQVHAVSTPSPPSPGQGSPPSDPATPPPQMLGVDELTILTSWAEAAAEAAVLAPDRLGDLLADAGPRAPWRAALGIDEPSPQLHDAIETVGDAVRGATTGDVPTSDALVVAVREALPSEQGPHRLARRVLLAALESRLAREAMTP